MTDATATSHGDRVQIAQIADLTVTPVQQVCDWIVAHKLDACRACTGFRIEELGLGELVPVLRSRRDDLGSRS
jgi:hypothetical protein